MNYLLDTNVISEILKKSPSKEVTVWFENIPSSSLYLSSLTIGEIRRGIEKLDDSPKRNKLVLWLEVDVLEWFENRIIPIDEKIADHWGYQLSKLKSLPSAIDSLIAATALFKNLILVTRNIKDFSVFKDLSLINPWVS